MVFMFNHGNVNFTAPLDMENPRKVFLFIKNQKQRMTSADLNRGIDNSGNFIDFLDEIFNLEFSDKPDYSGL